VRRRSGIVLLFVILAVTPFLGAESVSFNSLLEPGSLGHRIFFELRLPRFALTLIAGAALALLGGTYQILFSNALAEPYILGISSAVTLGIVSAEVLLGVNPNSVTGALCGAAGAATATATLIVLYVSHAGRQVQRLVLFGMGLNFVLSSTLFLLMSYVYQQMGSGSLRWLFGQIPWVTRSEIGWLTAVSVPLIALLFLFSRHLDALSLGDSVARTLGYSPLRSRTLILCLSSALLASIVYFTGAIGFVGLVVPHTARLIFRPSNTRSLFLLTLLVGAAFLCLADVISRVLLPPFEFPIGVITTLLGGPIFLFLLWRR